MSLDDVLDSFFAATLRDWSADAARYGGGCSHGASPLQNLPAGVD